MNPSSMRLSAMNFLAMREHSKLELKTKLCKKFPESIEEIEVLLEQLEEQALLSDERFTESFIRSRIKKAHGPVKIRYELGLKGISEDIIEYNMGHYEEAWQECIKLAWNKRFSREIKQDIDNYKDRAKQSRYLYQRGFTSDQINAFLNNKSQL